MKAIKLYAVALVALAALASCYFEGNHTGRLDLAFVQNGATARAPGDVLRVYLLADGLLFSTDGRLPFSAEVALAALESEIRVSIEGLPVGPRYQALVGYGSVAGGLLRVEGFGESGEFAVSPKSSATVPVVLEENQYLSEIFYSPDLQGRHIKGVLASVFPHYAAEERTVHRFDFDPFGAGLSVDDNTGLSPYSINSLSEDRGSLAGYDGLANTSGGVVPFSGEGWNFDSAFSSGLAGAKSILESGSIGDNYLFFRRADGLGGVVPSGEPESWIWRNRDLPGVLDMALSEYNAYFATTGGAFVLPPQFLDDGDFTRRQTLPAPAPILSLGFRPAGVFAGGTLYMGTTDGVWETVVDEGEGISVGELSRVDGTAGRRIEMIAISDYLDYAAYLSRYWLFIRRDGSTYRIPFFAVIPGRATGMTWSSDGSNLYVSGTEGLSAIRIYIGS